jgi:hypothetical protein
MAGSLIYLNVENTNVHMRAYGHKEIRNELFDISLMVLTSSDLTMKLPWHILLYL